MRERTSRIVCALLLALAVAAVFATGVGDFHLSGDDWGYTIGCPFVKDGVSLANIGRALTDFTYCAIWMPVTYFTYMLDISLFGGGWTVHLGANVLLHAVTAVVVFAFLLMLARRLFGLEGSAATAVCLLGALLWALHPMRAEVASYVSSRKEALWTLFALLGLMEWMLFCEKGGRLRYAAVMLCFVLSCMSKPTAVCFPPLAYALKAALERKLLCRVWTVVPMLAVSTAVGLLTIHSQAHPTDMASVDVFGSGLGWRMLNAAVSLGLYVWHTVVPGTIHVDYRAVFNGWPVDGGLGLGLLATCLLATVVGILYARDKSTQILIAFSAAWFVLGLLPTLGVFGYVNGDQAYADRYSYLPNLAFSFLLLPLASRQVRQTVERQVVERASRPFFVLVVLALLIGEVIVDVPVIRSFRSDYTAFARTLEKDPDHWRALRIVGNEYCARLGRMDEGVRMLRKSLRLRGSQRTADALAYILALRGASGDDAEVLRLGAPFVANPRRDIHGLMLDALGIVCLRQGKPAQAVKFFQASLKAPAREHALHYTQDNLEKAKAALTSTAR